MNTLIERSEYPEIWNRFNSGESISLLSAKYNVAYNTMRSVVEQLIKDPNKRVIQRVELNYAEAKVVYDSLVDPTIKDAIKDPSILDRYR